MARPLSRLIKGLQRHFAHPILACLILPGIPGGVWGLALARAGAESDPTSPLLSFGPTLILASLIGLATGVGGWAAWRKTASREFGAVFIPLLLAAVYLFCPGVAPMVGWTLLSGGLGLVFLLGATKLRQASRFHSIAADSWLIAAVLASVVLALYLRTLAPSVGRADTYEFQVVAPTLGIAHPTGYPLYILIGKLFSLLPVGSVAWRVNLTSAIFGVAAAMVLYGVLVRLSRRALVSLLAAMSFAFSRVFWSQTVVAEVYALHNLFVITIIMLLFEWLGLWKNGLPSGNSRNSTPTAARESEPKRSGARLIYPLALLMGLSLANHLTTVLLMPVVLLTWLVARPSLRPKVWLTALALFSIGIALYLYIFFRWPMLHEGQWMSLTDFWRYVTGQQFGGALRVGAWRTDWTRYQIVGRLLRDAYGWPGLALGAIGLLWLYRISRRGALITLATFLVYVWYGLSYYVPDVEVFLLPAHLVLALWLGLGATAMVDAWTTLARSAPRVIGWGSKGSVVLVSLFALLPLGLVWTNFSIVDQSDEWDAHAWGDWVLDMPLEPGSAILADSVRVAPLYYLQRIEGRRPDLDILQLANEEIYRKELEARLAAGQTVYLARFLPGLEGRYHLRSMGPLTEVGTAPVVVPPSLDRELGIVFGAAAQDDFSAEEHAGIELLGITGPGVEPDGGWGLTFYWRADQPFRETYHVRLRLVDNDGRAWWQEEGRHAANNYYPTIAWHPSEIVADFHQVPAPLSAAVGSRTDFTLEVGWFRPFSDEGLLVEGGNAWYPLARLAPTEKTARADPRYLLGARFDAASKMIVLPLQGRLTSYRIDHGLHLLGVDLPEIVDAMAPVALDLFWSGVDTKAVPGGENLAAGPERGEAPTQIVLAWINRRGDATVAPILESWGWSRLLVRAPSVPGEYALRLRLVEGRGEPLTAQCGWLARSTESCVLATVEVISATAKVLANFGGKIALLDAQFDLTRSEVASIRVLAPGQTMPVTLYWQGLRLLEEDYTVSVQLIGPDGQLYGQTDSWPVQGTLPTSQWAPGHEVVDPYRVLLQSKAPPGRYRVGVVVYQLETQTRLSVLDDSGRSVGDVVWISELEVGAP